MPRRTRRPAARRVTAANGNEAPSRRDDVIRQSATLFDERGYHSTSMEDIASAVGVRKPTLYHYVQSKDEILYWIHEEFIDLLISRQERRMSTAMSPEQLVLEVMGDILELMETHRGHVRVFFEHHRELPTDEHAAIAAKRERYESAVAAVIQRGVDEGAFRPVDVKLATLALFGICNWAYQWYRADGPLRSREVAYVFWDLLLNGLANPRR
ncbi:TetR/AcrR family transcriptional regulator [Conexibacter sp. CPCC 206217]|uniref:TetR/AcrR family transcriptional regulator n=1 Tax=Conexibacter sp. CPCC 206217 TaxID=3064574 RepID=UPI002726D4B4|nr:TetR/AcrR family transcriptional regulator [Conexibacter sp. CPCC 206217]MDO8212604.1 TetR/AcrR family transcriptional regulator [Conexibacter sp. CPCC 206217]